MFYKTFKTQHDGRTTGAYGYGCYDLSNLPQTLPTLDGVAQLCKWGSKRENSEYPNLPLFTAESLLSRDDILSSFSDHGVFIYPWKTKDYSLEDVAQSFQMSLKDPKFAWLRNRNFLK